MTKNRLLLSDTDKYWGMFSKSLDIVDQYFTIFGYEKTFDQQDVVKARTSFTRAKGT